MKSRIIVGLVILTVGLQAAPGFASQQQDLLELKKTTYRLIDLLVEEGVLSADKAEQMKREAEAEAATEVVRESVAESVEPGAVRVTYVPDIVKEEIKQDLRKEMKAEVLADVRKQASDERWGVPGTWPQWVDRISFDGDLRFRGQGDYFGNGNFMNSYVDVNRINDKRSFDLASQDSFRNFLNTTKDRDRLRARARLGMNARVDKNWRAGLRLVTGSIDDPVSTNETLGNGGSKFDVSFDRAYLQYLHADGFDRPIFSVTGGRFANPFVSTDLVWDEDYNFEGLSASYKYWFFNRAGGNVNNVFVTAGVFPIDEFGAFSGDKWLYGAQLGLDIQLLKQHRLLLAAAYYDYRKIEGKANPVDSRINDHTAPDFVQKGNTLFDIDSSSIVTDPAGTSQLYGLASDYNLINYTARLEWQRFDPINVALFFDYVSNDGFDKNEVLDRVTGRNVIAAENRIDDRTDGYKYGIELGHVKIRRLHDWQVSLAYKYLEADAVLDAFADSDFHGGGTDAKGWIFSGSYGVGNNTLLKMTFLSADEIDGVPLNVDTLQLDWVSKY
jgi:hypothetical protein